MKSFKTLTSVIIAVAFIVSFSFTPADAGQKKTWGTLIGAVFGAVAGANVGKGKGRDASIAIGAVLGSLAGSSVGESLDRIDKLNRNVVLETAPIGSVSTWVNPDSGHTVSVAPRRTYRTSRGTYCREFLQTITVGGKKQQGYGTACRQIGRAHV